jgi:hypothetical protein
LEPLLDDPFDPLLLEPFQPLLEPLPPAPASWRTVPIPLSLAAMPPSTPRSCQSP